MPGPKWIAEDVGERADAEVAGVLLVGVPGVALELVDGGDDLGSLPQVRRVQVSTICSVVRLGFQASLPKP